MLLRYRRALARSGAQRAAWDRLEERLQALPQTYHGNWTSYDEGLYQTSMGFQAATKLKAIACMIKQHDRFELEQSRWHAIECLRAAADLGWTGD